MCYGGTGKIVESASSPMPRSTMLCSLRRTAWSYFRDLVKAAESTAFTFQFKNESIKHGVGGKFESALIGHRIVRWESFDHRGNGVGRAHDGSLEEFFLRLLQR
jgi:hypothetical protein